MLVFPGFFWLVMSVLRELLVMSGLGRGRYGPIPGVWYIHSVVQGKAFLGRGENPLSCSRYILTFLVLDFTFHLEFNIEMSYQVPKGLIFSSDARLKP